MSVLSSAVASPRNLYSGTVGTALTAVYTAPSQSTNVTSPSATAYVKEIALCNSTASSTWMTLYINGAMVLGGLIINANDTKILSGLNTMINAGATISIQSGVASGISAVISGVEVQ